VAALEGGGEGGQSSRHLEGRLQDEIGRSPHLVRHPVRAGHGDGEAIADPGVVPGLVQDRESIGVAQVVAEGYDGRRPEVREEALERLAFPASGSRP
jgi:hypothetical protein